MIRFLTIQRKDSHHVEKQQTNDLKMNDNQDKNRPKVEKIDSKKANSNTNQHIKHAEKVDLKKLQNDSNHINGHDVEADKTSVKLATLEHDVLVGNSNFDETTDEEGIAYNLTGKLKLLDDMIINETTNHEEQGKD